MMPPLLMTDTSMLSMPFSSAKYVLSRARISVELLALVLVLVVTETRGASTGTHAFVTAISLQMLLDAKIVEHMPLARFVTNCLHIVSKN